MLMTTSADSVRTVVLENEPREGGSTNENAVETAWPFVQLYDFDGITTDTFDVVYNDDDTVTVAYDDDLTDSVVLSLDRANAPQGGTVHLTISDTRLNLDPTGSDEWILDTNHTEGDTVVNICQICPRYYQHLTWIWATNMDLLPFHLT